MDRKKLFKYILYLILFIFVANLIADKFYLYSSVWYFDMPMHFLGGFWLGLVMIWFLYSKIALSGFSLKLIIKIFLGIFLIGISWEVFELFFKNAIAQNPFNTLDTISDLFFDLSVGTLSVLYLLRKI
jgi:hypothetical protein